MVSIMSALHITIRLIIGKYQVKQQSVCRRQDQRTWMKPMQTCTPHENSVTGEQTRPQHTLPHFGGG